MGFVVFFFRTSDPNPKEACRKAKEKTQEYFPDDKNIREVHAMFKETKKDFKVGEYQGKGETFEIPVALL